MDSGVVNNAKQIGLNLSQFCENALKEAIFRLNMASDSQNSEKERFSLSIK